MSSLRAAIAAGFALAILPAHAHAGCPASATAPGVSRIVEIDTSGGPMFGALTAQAREESFLAPKEVVLTFDDGPLPRITRSILDTLDRFCTKATFFPVGRMAAAYPALTREIAERGHTIGSHTWSHPNLARLRPERAHAQIEAGFAAVALAAGQPIAPFFRFPGLNDSSGLLDHLQRRGIAAFTVDVVSNDSYIADPGRLIDRTLQQAHARNGGILLFHDIKVVTARALPTILRELRADGFSIVHLRPKAPYIPDESDIAALREHDRRLGEERLSGPMSMLEFTGGDLDAAGRDGPPVTALAPDPRDRRVPTRPTEVARETVAQETTADAEFAPRPRRRRPAQAPENVWSAEWRRFWQGLGS